MKQLEETTPFCILTYNVFVNVNPREGLTDTRHKQDTLIIRWVLESG